MNTISPVKFWRNQKKIASLLGREGKIESYTIVHVPPAGFEVEAPYPVVLVNFGKSKYTAQLVDYQTKELKIGQKVKAVLRKIKEPDREGIIPYGIKFTPV